MTAEFPLAVHALVYLVHKDGCVSSLELADNICTNPARVRKVMTRLHHAGLIEAARGQGSGYKALPDTGSLRLSTVLEALSEEPLSMNWRSGDIDRECLISSGMGLVMDGIYASLNKECMSLLSQMTIGEIVERLFKNKEDSK